MTGQTNPYVRVYFTVLEDPRFENVYHDARILGTWLQLLILADGMFPEPAPIPAFVDQEAVEVLVDAGLIDCLPHLHYKVHGLAREREMRSHNARIAAEERWKKARNAEHMPNRTEPNLDSPLTSFEVPPNLELVAESTPVPRRATPRQIVYGWLTDHGARGPSGWAIKALDELIHVHTAAAVIAVWDEMPSAKRTSEVYVRHAQQALGGTTKPTSTNQRGGTRSEKEVHDAFER